MITHRISACRHNNLLMYPMKGSKFWSHQSARTTDGTYLKKRLSVRPKIALGIRKRKKENNKLLWLQSNAIIKTTKLNWWCESFL